MTSILSILGPYDPSINADELFPSVQSNLNAVGSGHPFSGSAVTEVCAAEPEALAKTILSSVAMQLTFTLLVP